MNEFETMKDKTAIGELKIIISELQALVAKAEANVGKSRPIVNSSDIEIIKDHLDLVIKYTRL